MTKTKCRALYATAKLGDKNILIMKPQTFMNLSGESVRDMAESYKIPPERIIVVFDDTALPEGKIRIKRKGSDGGHNGIKNIIYHLQSDAFPRVKIGIGAKDTDDLADYVLSELDGETIKAAREIAPDAVISIIENGVDTAMQDYNGK